MGGATDVLTLDGKHANVLRSEGDACGRLREQVQTTTGTRTAARRSTSAPT